VKIAFTMNHKKKKGGEPPIFYAQKELHIVLLDNNIIYADESEEKAFLYGIDYSIKNQKPTIMQSILTPKIVINYIQKIKGEIKIEKS